MVPTPLSSILISSFIVEGSIRNEDFSNLSSPEQLAVVSTVGQDICNLHFDKNKKNYTGNNYTNPVAVPSGGGGTSDDNSRAGFIVATAAGTPFTFTRAGEPAPFTAKPILTFVQLGVSCVDPNTGVDTLTKDGGTAYTAGEEITTGYIAKEAT